MMIDVPTIVGEALDRMASLYGFTREMTNAGLETDQELRDRLLLAIRGAARTPHYIEIKLDLPIEKKCECGGHIAKTGHSDWCPVFVRF